MLALPPGRDRLFPDPNEWVNDGDSVVIDPQGKLVAGPMRREQGILYATIDIARVAPARRTLDVTGHYARPDIFELRVRRTPAAPVRYIDDGGLEAKAEVTEPNDAVAAFGESPGTGAYSLVRPLTAQTIDQH